MSFEIIKYRQEGALAILTLDRPEASNAIDARMAFELREAVQKVKDSENIRVMLLTGSGSQFSIGTTLETALAASHPSYLESLRICRWIASLECPVIAAINGDARGHGLELALACDIRLAVDSATFAMDQIRDGLIPWDGGTQQLPRLVGRGAALYMILSGQPIDAQKARQWGLVHQVFPRATLIKETLELAGRISECAPIALRYAKEAVQKGMELTLEQGMRLEEDLTLILQTTQDRAEGIEAFLQKRKPHYIGK